MPANLGVKERVPLKGTRNSVAYRAGNSSCSRSRKNAGMSSVWTSSRNSQNRADTTPSWWPSTLQVNVLTLLKQSPQSPLPGKFIVCCWSKIQKEKKESDLPGSNRRHQDHVIKYPLQSCALPTELRSEHMNCSLMLLLKLNLPRLDVPPHQNGRSEL